MSGPVTTDTSTLALGLAQIRVGVSAANIANIHPVFTASDSIGSLANTKFMSNTDYFKHEAGFPLLEDYTIALRESASLECTFEEISPKNLAYAMGIDASSGYTDVHSGEVTLGGRTAPAYVRMEANYTFPNGSNYMNIIFPRAQIVSSIEIDLQKETNAGVPITFESKTADSNVSGGSAVWDSKPLGRIVFT
jgi:hypothetical protein